LSQTPKPWFRHHSQGENPNPKRLTTICFLNRWGAIQLLRPSA
jgi:hypothetical protein